jgi:Fe-S cluster assembly protein SufD
LALPASNHLLTLIFLGEHSTLELTQGAPQEAVAVQRLFVWQAADSSFVYNGVRCGSPFLNEKVRVMLQGPRARADITHFTLGRGQDQLDIAVRVDHAAPHTVSNVRVRSAAAGASTTIYHGFLDVAQRAQGTAGYQHGEALLLSPHAIVDCVPELSIHTGDVRASHGVTTTHLDPERLFYMRSRGLAEAAARELAIHALYEHDLVLPQNLRQAIEDMAKEASV